MFTRDLHFFELPPERIAQRPAEPRDASRLMILDRRTGSITHRYFRDLCEYVHSGDLLVRNNTRVLPARFEACRATGGRVEGLFLSESDGLWRALLKAGGRLQPGERLELPADSGSLELVTPGQGGEWTLRPPDMPTVDLLARIGSPPLPPYIRGGSGDEADRDRYQTVYAESAGSVAAPTAGLHFTPELLARVAAAGVDVVDVTLHVGMGTFAPIRAERLHDHRMHTEWYEVSAEAAARVVAAGRAGQRVVAVGTTSARVLESLPGVPMAVAGWTEIFIYPPYRFQRVGALLTNFHLPGSTLLALVIALAGEPLIHAAYHEAIETGYRFYSYGDAMLIL